MRAKWSDIDLKKAMDAVRRGASVLGASRHYNIPRRTLRNHLDNVFKDKRLGKPQILGSQHQLELEKRVMSLLEIGVAVNSSVVKHCISSFYVANSVNDNVSDNMNVTVIHWLRNFISQNPTANRLSNADPVKEYFERLAKVMVEQDLFSQPERIYSLEEKCCPLTLQHQIQILNKGIDAASPDLAEKVSITFASNAIGNVIPPMVFFKGKKVKQDWLDNAPARSELITCPSGIITSKIFSYWIDHFVKFKVAGSVLLIFDSITFPVDYSIIQMAKKRDITMLCLPNVSTKELQPMHKGVYKSFEDHWDAEVLQLWSKTPALPIIEQNFGWVFKEAWERSMTLSSICSGFRLTGIFPYDRDVLPDAPKGGEDVDVKIAKVDSSLIEPKSAKNSRNSQTDEIHSNEMFSERFTAEFIESQQLPRKKKKKIEYKAPVQRPRRSTTSLLTKEITSNIHDSGISESPYCAIQSTHKLWNTWNAWNSS